MKSSKAIDADIAQKLMGLKVTDPNNIPNYSTNIFDSHAIIRHLQMNGWSCHVRSTITKDGTLFYRAHFHKSKKLHSEQVATTIPMAVCMAALAIVNEQYVEFVDEHEDDKPIELSQSLADAGLSEITVDDASIIDLLSKTLEERDLPFKDKEGNRQTFHRLFFKLVIGGFMSRENQDSLPRTLAGFFIDILKENGYIIAKKAEDSE